MKQGIPGKSVIPEKALQYCRGEVSPLSDGPFDYNFQLHTYHAACYDWTQNRQQFYEHWAWNGEPTHTVPKYKGMRTLVVGPEEVPRVWGNNKKRMFSDLKGNVAFVKELNNDEYESIMKDMIRDSAEEQGDTESDKYYYNGNQ